MITKKTLENAIFNTIKKSSCQISPDIHSAFERAIDSEQTEKAKRGFETTLESLDQSAKFHNPLCPDTGWPLFFFKTGNDTKIEGGILGLEEVAKKMVERATKEGYLRSTMKHPLTGDDPGTNVGTNIPGFTYKFVPGDSIQITYVAKGGGSECFGGTRYRVVAFADGITGIKKSIVDWFIAASRAGAICPPSILGIGLGGTADIATSLAKKAAVLRLIGSHHSEPTIAKIEEDLTMALNRLGVGPTGSGGATSVFAVNVEYSLTHIAGIAVAMSSNCWVGRRATLKIYVDGRTEELDNPNWFDRNENGDIYLRKFGGHTQPRSAISGDVTGREMMWALKRKCWDNDLIEVVDETYITQLLITDGKIAGAMGVNLTTGEIFVFECPAVILTNGGSGRLWPITFSTKGKCGDGLRMAYEAGAELVDMEFFQIHPTGWNGHPK